MIIAPRRGQPLTEEGAPTNRFAEYLEEVANTTNALVSNEETFAITNSNVLRTFDADTVTTAQLADYVATLTDVLKAAGIVK